MFRRYVHAAIILLVSALAVAACSTSTDRASGSDLEGRITLTGSSTIAPLVSEIAKRFEQRQPAVRIDVQTGGSSRGITDATRGMADIGMSSRALTDSEKADLVSHTIATDGVCLLVHATNPVENLTDDHIRAIYSGKVTNWRQVGGHDAPITVVNRADGRSELELFTNYFGINAADIHASLISGENQHGIKTVAGDPNAIVYMSVGASEFEAGRGVPVKLLRWNGIEASSRTVAEGRFPLSRPLILVTRPKPPALVQRFIEFARSDDMHDVVRQFAYVPVN